MAKTQKYGIKYPFSNENDDNVYVDINQTYEESIKSKVLHVLFTPKGQRMRRPDFGTDLIKYLFEPVDENLISSLKSDLSADITSQVPEVKFEDITIAASEGSDNERIVIVHYTIKGSDEITSVAVKI